MSAIIIYNELIYGGYMRLNINDKEKVKNIGIFFIITHLQVFTKIKFGH